MARDDGNQLNEALRLLRVYHDLSRSDLIAGLDISKSYLSEIESGSKQVSFELVKKYADYFDMKPSAILFLGESLAESNLAKSVETLIAEKTRQLMSWIAERQMDELEES